MSRSRAHLVPVAALVGGGLAWWWAVARMQGMSAAPTVQLGTLPWFTVTWVAMMAAMMLPAAAPTLQSRAVPAAAGYLAVWAIVGVGAYLALGAGRALTGDTLAWHRGGHAACVAVIAIAALYQLTAVKRRWLGRCRAPVIGGSTRTAARAGARAGVCCAASSSALMAVLFALGAMSLRWMAAVTVLVGAERLTPAGWWPAIRALSAAVLIALAVLLALSPGSVPGFAVPGHMTRGAMSMSGM